MVGCIKVRDDFVYMRRLGNSPVHGIGSHDQPYDLLLAGSLLSLIPPLLLFFAVQRFFVKSLVAGAFK